MEYRNFFENLKFINIVIFFCEDRLQTLFFAHFVNIWKKLPYISFMTAFMLNLFGKNLTKFQNDIMLPQAAILGLTNEGNNIYNLLNHILLVFEYYVYRSREKHILDIGI